ncbi:methyltransferase family protein [Pseudoduganella flava]|uniref:Methyltransferase n=1 Tax=Pseudoduganella flava TaxID=871742 RepID=A0A562PDE2_9BURK|nr:class I SAM-dependent methyltransferase [Pseudoduganella flava]QGZ42124.1 methyltransferase [Pseudoduganella flava]TWI42505.1 methyltransferase family protein [Pseudoduganella flava]
MDWNDGYVADIAYPITFFPEQSPTHLAATCILNGVEPIAPDAPFTYFELGAGMGLTSAVLAASHPHGTFYANDFQPGHVADARALAHEAQLDNLTLLECSFADLAAGKVDLPPLDFITMYGVYSWVTAENRRHIVNFIARYLKPGGIVYVNYNAMPGWSGVVPLQRLMLEHADRYPGGRARQVGTARAFVDRLAGVGATYFDGNAMLRQCLDTLHGDQTGYLAHEYLNRGWEPLYHADVVRDMADAKLDYVGAADPARAWPELFVDETRQALLADCPDPVLRETVWDYLHNTPFREDVLVRGARRMAPHRRQYWLERLAVARLVATDDEVPRPPAVPPEQAALLREQLLALRDALGGGAPVPLTRLAALPAFGGMPLAGVARLAAMLACGRQAAFCFTGAADADDAPAQRLNAVLAGRAEHGDQHQVLASPLLGNGMRAGLVQRLVYGVLADSPGHRGEDADAATAHVAALLERHARSLPPGPRTEELRKLQAELPQTVAAILRLRVPMWRAQRVL